MYTVRKSLNFRSNILLRARINPLPAVFSPKGINWYKLVPYKKVVYGRKFFSGGICQYPLARSEVDIIRTPSYF